MKIYFSGVTVCEFISGLKIEDENERSIQVSDSLMKEAMQYIQFRMIKPDGFMFSSDNGKHYTRDNIQTKLRDIMYTAQAKGITAQSFRDTFAINLLLEGSTIDNLIIKMGMTDRQRATRYVVYYERYKEDLCRQ